MNPNITEGSVTPEDFAKQAPKGDCPPTNCSAFPDPCGAHPGSHPPSEQKGMTLRDYFAAKAMAAMMSQPEAAHDWTDEKVAEWAYNAADAMLIRRQNTQGEARPHGQPTK